MPFWMRNLQCLFGWRDQLTELIHSNPTFYREQWKGLVQGHLAQAPFRGPWLLGLCLVYPVSGVDFLSTHTRPQHQEDFTVKHKQDFKSL